MDSEEEEEDEQQKSEEEGEAAEEKVKAAEDGKKKKKRKNKKKKNTDGADVTQQPAKAVATTSKPKPAKKDADSAFLDSIIKQTKEETKSIGVHSSHLLLSHPDTVLRMDRKQFNYKKELKSLFQKSAQAYGALGLDEEEKEERKNRGGNDLAEQYEGASKKVKRRLKMIERM